MGTPVMNPYRAQRRHFPLTLYRVEYDGVQTNYSRASGFQSGGDFTPLRVNGLRNAVRNHLNWRSRIPSPFISAFSSRRRAHAWARVWRENNNYGWCCVVVIKIEADHGVVVFSAADLVDRLGISPPSHQPQADYDSEYLCFRQIPPEAIVREASVSYPARLGYFMFDRGDSDADSGDDSDNGYYR